MTYGQSGVILLASGVSAPFGSLLYGWLADKIGRRKVMIATVLNFSLATGAMADILPDVLDRVEFRRVRREVQQAEVFWHVQPPG